MVGGVKQGFLLSALILLLLAGAVPDRGLAAEIDTNALLAACIADPVVTDDPAFAPGSDVTPEAYCECVAGKYKESELTQGDVDMMTKMHKDEITDEDAENYPKLEELMLTNEDFEDECRSSLGLPSREDEEGPPMEDEEMPIEEDIPQEE